MEQSMEIITLAEALARVRLGDLVSPENEQVLVGWSGYPRPFECGHTATYGFGPLDNPAENNNRGAGRRYQRPVRVSQEVCGGSVLFSWPRFGGEPPYRLNGSAVVSVTETLDAKATCLQVLITA